jgi:hypothetical protein
MPRQFDYDNNDKEAKRQAYDHGAPFANLPVIRKGHNEIELSVLFGPRGIFFMDAERHQFSRNVDFPRCYLNASADEAFAWLGDNVEGRWHWLEHATNHGHSVTTDVWIEGEADTEKFRQAFPEDFKYREGSNEGNLKRRAKLAAIPADKLPPGLGAGSLAFLFSRPTDETLAYVADIQTKEGGAALIGKAFAHSMRGIDEAPEDRQTEFLNDLMTFLDQHAAPETLEAVREALDESEAKAAVTLLSKMPMSEHHARTI